MKAKAQLLYVFTVYGRYTPPRGNACPSRTYHDSVQAYDIAELRMILISEIKERQISSLSPPLAFNHAAPVALGHDEINLIWLKIIGFILIWTKSEHWVEKIHLHARFINDCFFSLEVNKSVGCLLAGKTLKSLPIFLRKLGHETRHTFFLFSRTSKQATEEKEKGGKAGWTSVSLAKMC